MANRYGLSGWLKAQEGRGAELGDLLLNAAKLMEGAKGCILYVVTRPVDDPDAIAVFEVWESKDDHDNSLKLPGVRDLIQQAMPILDGAPEGTTLEVLGGKGLSELKGRQ